MINYLKTLLKHLPVSKELGVSMCFFLAISLIEFGVFKGLLFVAEWLSTISDATILVYIRVVYFKNKYDDATVKSKILQLPFFLILSVFFHSITFYFIGLKSFSLSFPMIIFLLSVYCIQKVYNFINR